MVISQVICRAVMWCAAIADDKWFFIHLMVKIILAPIFTIGFNQPSPFTTKLLTTPNHLIFNLNSRSYCYPSQTTQNSLNILSSFSLLAGHSSQDLEYPMVPFNIFWFMRMTNKSSSIKVSTIPENFEITVSILSLHHSMLDLVIKVGIIPENALRLLSASSPLFIILSCLVQHAWFNMLCAIRSINSSKLFTSSSNKCEHLLQCRCLTLPKSLATYLGRFLKRFLELKLINARLDWNTFPGCPLNMYVRWNYHMYLHW